MEGNEGNHKEKKENEQKRKGKRTKTKRNVTPGGTPTTNGIAGIEIDGICSKIKNVTPQLDMFGSILQRRDGCSDFGTFEKEFSGAWNLKTGNWEQKSKLGATNGYWGQKRSKLEAEMETGEIGD